MHMLWLIVFENWQHPGHDHFGRAKQTFLFSRPGVLIYVDSTVKQVVDTKLCHNFN